MLIKVNVATHGILLVLQATNSLEIFYISSVSNLITGGGQKQLSSIEGNKKLFIYLLEWE